ncbi:MAG: acetyl-CoA carboxylase biotin carboxyl carrier protein subunit [Chloroflexota bacterium]
MKFKVQVADLEEELEVIRQGDSLRVTWRGFTTEARVLHTDGAHFVLEYDRPGPDSFIFRRRLRAAGFLNDQHRQLWVNGSLVAYQRLPDKPASAPAAPTPDNSALTASIPAVVSEVLVKEGDRVAAGDKLILLESMKMILPIQSPYEGIVRRINCAAGAAVRPGIQLIELDEVVESTQANLRVKDS